MQIKNVPEIDPRDIRNRAFLLGITNKRLAKLFNVWPSQITRAFQGGEPGLLAKIAKYIQYRENRKAA